MASLSQANEMGDLFDKMTLGVVKALEKKCGVSDIQFEDKQPADRNAIYSWEQKNMCFLPNDLKDFYFTTDGISIQWSTKFDGGICPVGNMEINSISNLVSINQSLVISDDKPSLLDIDDLHDCEDCPDHMKPHFDDRNKCFELDSCLGFAKVCLVYKDIPTVGLAESSPEIWLVDRSLQWTFLASSFQTYFRMLMVHLGLPLWQYRFTSSGLSPETKRWFHLFAPSRIEEGEDELRKTLPEGNKSYVPKEHFNQLDITKLFKGKSDLIKMQGKPLKKKSQINSRINPSSRFAPSTMRSFHR